jgi:undecaprenyl-diphosphatase
MVLLSVTSTVANWILGLPAWLVLGVVFLLPALEASAFLGFIFPGETAAILGGVVASQGRIPLWAAILAVVSGAIIGDSIGYFVGRRWGTALLHGSIGRLPIIRRQLDRHLPAAEAYVRRRKGSAVFFGRFTAALRVLVPGLAGISGVHYPSFLAYNVAGGLAWGTTFTVLGFIAGASYARVAKIAGQIGLVLLGLIVLGLVLSWLIRRLEPRSRRLEMLAARLEESPPITWLKKRFPGQVGWVQDRLDPNAPRGFWLTFAVAVAAFAIWWFAAVTQDVVGHDELALVNPKFESWVIAHRIAWISSAMAVITWLGSATVTIPLLVLAVIGFVLGRRDQRSAVLLGATVACAIGTYDVIKLVVGEARPPASEWIGSFSGPAFPSGHTTQAVTFYGMLALLLSLKRRWIARALLWAAAALIALAVGASRIYLAAHWLTDVLGGIALGITWIAIVMAITLLLTRTAPARSVGAEKGRDVPRHQSRFFASGKMATAWHHGPAAHIVEAFRPLARRLPFGHEHVGKYRDRGRDPDQVVGTKSRFALRAPVVEVVAH